MLNLFNSCRCDESNDQKASSLSFSVLSVSLPPMTFFVSSVSFFLLSFPRRSALSRDNFLSFEEDILNIPSSSSSIGG